MKAVRDDGSCLSGEHHSENEEEETDIDEEKDEQTCRSERWTEKTKRPRLLSNGKRSHSGNANDPTVTSFDSKSIIPPSALPIPNSDLKLIQKGCISYMRMPFGFKEGSIWHSRATQPQQPDSFPDKL